MTPGNMAFARVSLARVARHGHALAERFLSPDEQREASALGVPKRATDRIAGRMAAHRALARLGLPSSGVAIVATPDGVARGAPSVVSASGAPLDVGLSITHGAGSACAIAALDCNVGLDIERVEPRDAAFVEDAFDPGAVHELVRLLGDRTPLDVAVTVAWCAKEACMKLARVGMRAPLRSFAPLAAWWDGPEPGSTHLALESLRPATLVTRELGVVRAGVLARADLAAVVAWKAV